MNLDSMTLDIELHIDIKTTAQAAFDGVVRMISEEMKYPDGRSMDHKLELWPGGRWFRDLGDNTGHLWGHVQTVKPPVLLELYGPMFMSYPVAGHIEFKVAETGDGVRVSLRHRALGFLEEAHRTGVKQGWGQMLDAIKGQLEG